MADGLLLVRTLLLASLVPVLMRLPLARVQALLEPAHAPARADPTSEQRVLRLVNLALEIGGPLLRPTCLTRGITRYYFLRRAGAPVSLAFGIGTAGGHCWLSRDGEPFLEPRDPRLFFTEMYRMPAC